MKKLLIAIVLSFALPAFTQTTVPDLFVIERAIDNETFVIGTLLTNGEFQGHIKDELNLKYDGTKVLERVETVNSIQYFLKVHFTDQDVAAEVNFGCYLDASVTLNKTLQDDEDAPPQVTLGSVGGFDYVLNGSKKITTFDFDGIVCLETASVPAE